MHGSGKLIMDLSSKVMRYIVAAGLVVSTLLMLIDNKEVVDITLNWSPATEFEDGNALTEFEIKSYVITWREDGGDLLGEVILDGSVQNYKIEKLEVGTYVFSIISESVYGTISRPLNITKTIGSMSSII